MHAYSVMDQNRAMKEDKGMYGEAQQHTQRPFSKRLKQHAQRPFTKCLKQFWPKTDRSKF